jgi:hypothetical protein
MGTCPAVFAYFASNPSISRFSALVPWSLSFCRIASPRWAGSGVNLVYPSGAVKISANRWELKIPKDISNLWEFIFPKIQNNG